MVASQALPSWNQIARFLETMRRLRDSVCFAAWRAAIRATTEAWTLPSRTGTWDPGGMSVSTSELNRRLSGKPASAPWVPRHSSWKQILAFLRKMAVLREMAGSAAW